MAYTYSDPQSLIHHILKQLTDACDLIICWNQSVISVDDYLCSPDGMQKMAATCMIIESIGEGIKKIDRLNQDFLTSNAPHIPWRNIKGLRDHIAHGYFNLDAEIIFDVAKNEIPGIRIELARLTDIAMTSF